jgi:hypothetical protein
MLDWSDVYFKKIVLAEKAWVGAGYMCTMATGRFIADGFNSSFGLKKLYKSVEVSQQQGC